MLNIEIRILNVNELNSFRAIRLSKIPNMFGSTYSVGVVKPLSFFEDCLSSLTIFGVYYKNKITGLAIITQEIGIKFFSKSTPIKHIY